MTTPTILLRMNLPQSRTVREALASNIRTERTHVELLNILPQMLHKVLHLLEHAHTLHVQAREEKHTRSNTVSVQ